MKWRILKPPPQLEKTGGSRKWRGPFLKPKESIYQTTTRLIPVEANLFFARTMVLSRGMWKVYVVFLNETRPFLYAELYEDFPHQQMIAEKQPFVPVRQLYGFHPFQQISRFSRQTGRGRRKFCDPGRQTRHQSPEMTKYHGRSGIETNRVTLKNV